MVLFTVLGINQARYREWEQLQSEIKISAEEAIQAFEEAGLHIENLEDTTTDVRDARYRYGDPLSAFHLHIVKEKLYYVLIVEYRDWKDANHLIEYINSYLGSDTPRTGLFSHGAVAILCDSPDENIEAQLKKILMDCHNLTKQEAQSR
jgi:hypothetical protein